MHVMVTGATGLLGRAVCDVLPASTGWKLTALSKADLDVTDASAAAKLMVQHAPDVVVHCAAYTNVDAAESHEAEAHRVNAEGAGIIAEQCRRIGARFVYPSTDYVFDGTAREPYHEAAMPGPINAYGRSKLAGEAAAAAAGDHLIVRTSWLFGAGGHNFVRTMVDRMNKQDPLRVVNDQIGAPSWTRDVANALKALIEKRAATGIYHVTNAGHTSWFDFAAEIKRILGSSTPLEPCSTSEIASARPARRPAYSVLDCGSTYELIGPLPQWQDSLRQAIAALDY